MKNNEQWQAFEEFLNTDITKPRLIMASIYNFAYSMLKESIIERLRSFICTGFRDNEDLRYRTEVLSLNKRQSPLYASLEWLKNMKAIEQSDIDIFDKIKKCRNDLAHEFNNIIIDKGFPDDYDVNFANLLYLFRKIETWWIMDVELLINPDYDGQDREDINKDDITTGPMVCLGILIDVALTENKAYYEDIKKGS